MKNIKDLVNKLNAIIDDKNDYIISEVKDIALTPIYFEKYVVVELNIQNGSIDIYTVEEGEEEETKPNTIEILRHFVEDVSTTEDELTILVAQKEVAKRLGVYNEWLEMVNEKLSETENDELGADAFYDFIEEVNKKDEFIELVWEIHEKNLFILLDFIDEGDLEDFDIENIEFEI